MKTIMRSGIIVILALMLAILVGCSSSKPPATVDKSKTGEPDMAEIDQLFGIADRDKASEPNADEAEVLQLLGIKSAEPTTPAAADQPTSQKEDQLKAEISELERKLAEKDSEILSLKSDLMAREDKISKLETGAAPQVQPRSAARAATGNFRDDYQAALAEYNSRNYKVAIQMFEELLAREPANSLSDNCRYWIGECYYGLGNFNQAIIEFTKVFSYNRSNKADAAQLKLGLCYWRLGNQERARQEFERLISDYPKSEYVGKAQQFLSRL
ncbi:MAG: tetratricopeptide repeat protein [candidate division KSB1 bacterium]|nr:tetratricopeptide repeat protein [candidate division KSB1 bacterium]MDZ7319170.1 tetratricopeptide repeat protein [candidate division KSB1 bacterium]MDZ7341425.1 tetratricopeptide repeat protein [candidate division KSB1 bacterium]